jgi:Ca2+-transporting ATPase
MAAGVGVLLLAVFGIPWLRALMGLLPLSATGMAAAAGLLALCLVWLEGVRLFSRAGNQSRG